MRSKLLALAAFAALGPGRAEAAPLVPADAAVLPASATAQLLDQCSRGAPPPGEGGWQPGGAEIAALEAALPAALDPGRHLSVDLSRAPEGWRRQYVGIVRGGRRFIYGNFFVRPKGGSEGDGSWRIRPVMVCDGGASFFGVEYDVESARFTHVEFNGGG